MDRKERLRTQGQINHSEGKPRFSTLCRFLDRERSFVLEFGLGFVESSVWTSQPSLDAGVVGGGVLAQGLISHCIIIRSLPDRVSHLKLERVLPDRDHNQPISDLK